MQGGIDLKVKNLVKKYDGKTVVDSVSFDRRRRKAAVLKTRLTRMAQTIPARAGHRRALGQLS